MCQQGEPITTSCRAASRRSASAGDGHRPGYLKLITKDFDLARQTALGIRLAYDAGRVGAPGLVGRFFFASGIDAVNPNGRTPEPDERE